MLETNDLFLDKGKFSDWSDMYHNVWSRPQSAKYMMWRVTASESDARQRMRRTIEFQKSHDTYLVYEKKSGRAIGFAGAEQLEPGVYSETGICLGPEYVGKGFGKQIVKCLMLYCKNEFGAEEFVYSTREENEPSNRLAKSLGFCRFASEEKVDDRDGHRYTLVKYRIKL